MKTKAVKIAMDIVMVILFVLLYNTRVLGLSFHEIGGLFLGGLFIVHGILNGKWIVSITKHLTKKSMSMRSKVRYAVSGMLFTAFAMVILSGIFISKVLFLGISIPGPWQQIHLFSAGMALILVGVHLGLHWGWVKQNLDRIFPKPTKTRKIAGMVVVTVLLLFGSYNVFTSNCARIISIPMTSTSMPNRSDLAPNATSTENHNRRPNNLNGAHNKTQQNIRNINDHQEYRQGDNHSGNRHGDMKVNRVGEGRLQNSIKIGTLFKTIATYLSIVFVFAALTIFLDKRYFSKGKGVTRQQ